MKMAAAAVALLCTSFAQAQRQVDVKGSVGVASFVDESSDHHFLTGGSARFYLTRKFSVEPEFLYLRRDRYHSDLVLIPHLVYEFGGRRVTPYVSGGIGLMRTSDTGFLRTNTNTEMALSGRSGVKIYLNDRWFVAPEAAVGWELHVRFSAGIGYTWRR